MILTTKLTKGPRTYRTLKQIFFKYILKIPKMSKILKANTLNYCCNTFCDNRGKATLGRQLKNTLEHTQVFFK